MCSAKLFTHQPDYPQLLLPEARAGRQKFFFLSRAGAPQCRIAVRKAAEPDDDFFVLASEVEVALQLLFQILWRVTNQLRKTCHALGLQRQIFSMHQRHVHEDAPHPGQLLVCMVGDGLLHQLLGMLVAAEGMALAPEHVACELVEQYQLRQLTQRRRAGSCRPVTEFAIQCLQDPRAET